MRPYIDKIKSGAIYGIPLAIRTAAQYKKTVSVAIGMGIELISEGSVSSILSSNIPMPASLTIQAELDVLSDNRRSYRSAASASAQSSSASAQSSSASAQSQTALSSTQYLDNLYKRTRVLEMAMVSSSPMMESAKLLPSYIEYLLTTTEEELASSEQKLEKAVRYLNSATFICLGLASRNSELPLELQINANQLEIIENSLIRIQKITIANSPEQSQGIFKWGTEQEKYISTIQSKLGLKNGEPSRLPQRLADEYLDAQLVLKVKNAEKLQTMKEAIKSEILEQHSTYLESINSLQPVTKDSDTSDLGMEYYERKRKEYYDKIKDKLQTSKALGAIGSEIPIMDAQIAAMEKELNNIGIRCRNQLEMVIDNAINTLDKLKSSTTSLGNEIKNLSWNKKSFGICAIIAGIGTMLYASGALSYIAKNPSSLLSIGKWMKKLFFGVKPSPTLLETASSTIHSISETIPKTVAETIPIVQQAVKEPLPAMAAGAAGAGLAAKATKAVFRVFKRK